VVRDYLFLRQTQVAKCFNRTPWQVSVTGGLHFPLVVSVVPALPTAGLHARLLRVHPGRSLPILHVNAVLFVTTRIAFMAYLSSLTGMRRRAFADARHALNGDGDRPQAWTSQLGETGIRVERCWTRRLEPPGSRHSVRSSSSPIRRE
jgi:hypothetical protein